MRIPEFTLGSELTDEQRAFFDAYGFIRFREFASPDEVRRLVWATDELSRRFVAEDRKTVMGIPLRYGTDADGQRYVNRFAFTSHYSSEIRAFVDDPRFEPIRKLCGPDARLAHLEKDGVVINHFMNSPGSKWKRLGWHTDALRDLFYGMLPKPMLNVGIYLDDCPREKGGVRLIPGTHTQGLWPMLTRKLYFLDNRPDPEEVALETRAGDLTIHDGRLWHRTAQATVTGEASRRRTMYLAFVDGPYHPRTEETRPPLYHRLNRLVG